MLGLVTALSFVALTACQRKEAPSGTQPTAGDTKAARTVTIWWTK